MLITNFHPLPILQTLRLRLQQLEEKDAERLFMMRSNKEIMKYICRPIAKNVDDALQLIKAINASIEKNECANWGIFLQENNLLIGSIGFVRVKKEHYRGEIGYLLDTAFHQKGFMSEALKVVLQYGFSEVKFHSVEAIIEPENIASANLLKKHGFLQEALFKEDYYFEGKFLDTAVYSLLERDHLYRH
jgi:ribosomal-protein-alanine N-acetyltransferase